MAKLKYRTISKRTVDALSVQDRDAVFWDDRLPGFGVRVYPSGSKVYVVQSRHRGRSKRFHPRAPRRHHRRRRAP